MFQHKHRGKNTGKNQRRVNLRVEHTMKCKTICQSQWTFQLNQHVVQWSQKLRATHYKKKNLMWIRIQLMTHLRKTEWAATIN